MTIEELILTPEFLRIFDDALYQRLEESSPDLFTYEYDGPIGFSAIAADPEQFDGLFEAEPEFTTTGRRFHGFFKGVVIRTGDSGQKIKGAATGGFELFLRHGLDGVLLETLEEQAVIFAWPTRWPGIGGPLPEGSAEDEVIEAGAR